MTSTSSATARKFHGLCFVKNRSFQIANPPKSTSERRVLKRLEMWNKRKAEKVTLSFVGDEFVLIH